LPLSQKGLLIAQRNNIDHEVGEILNIMGISYALQGEYGKSLDYFFKRLVLSQSKDTIDSHSYNNIGLVYYKLQNFPRAIMYYKKALRVHESKKDTTEVGRILTNIGLGYCEL